MTHGGGWTLLMRLDGSDDAFAYDAISWETTSNLNESPNQPNADASGLNAKFRVPQQNAWYHPTNVEFVAPTEHNITSMIWVTCSDDSRFSSTIVENCICEIHQHSTEATCIAAGECSDPQYINDTDCSNAGESWTSSFT